MATAVLRVAHVRSQARGVQADELNKLQNRTPASWTCCSANFHISRWHVQCTCRQQVSRGGRVPWVCVAGMCSATTSVLIQVFARSARRHDCSEQ